MRFCSYFYIPHLQAEVTETLSYFVKRFNQHRVAQWLEKGSLHESQLAEMQKW